MKQNNAIVVLLFLLVAGVWVLVIQSVRLISLVSDRPVPVTISGKVDASGSRVQVSGQVDTNLSAVVGFPLVRTEQAFHVGVASQAGTVIPIDWGEISLEQGMQPVDVRVTSLPKQVDVNINAVGGHEFSPLQIHTLSPALPIQVQK